MSAPTVAACQHAIADCDPAANVATVRTRLAGLADRVDVAVFPEYALTGFVADDRVSDAALARDGAELATIADAAERAETAALVGFVEDAGDGLYNTLGYLGRDGERSYYRKRHLWGDETDVLDAGDRRTVVETPVGRTAFLTCYDLNFVRESAALVDADVDALFVPGAWPAVHASNWDLLLRARALDGVRWVVGCGRTGARTLGDPCEYAGRSAVVRPDGTVRARLGRDERDLVAPLDPAILAEQRALVGSVGESRE
ncbi:carbon-nitrogen hydrolase family protein [Halarchaeum nitratireducens]|uniref:Hydrolase n=1 Tax=Halarchaeum nitratireducens TaxID=489913 RepID=A0A830GBI0_9EURY|nr:nitrilase-related carbon-nitrogen hydrolase [Halarchaeum nitratireducens]GGN16537.1 hydrolase [Halarchaeum nitratireducens]